jgi:hypothetical protein
MAAMTTHTGAQPAAKRVRQRVRRGGERFWRQGDFPELPAGAVSQALSRLTRKGELQRVSKGLYYRPRQTIVGASRPAPDAVVAHTTKRRLQPAGLTAANLLGFTTQNPGRPEYTTSSATAPRALKGVHVRTRRERGRESLSSRESALLEFLRDRGRTSDLDDEATCRRLLQLLNEKDAYARLVAASWGEPPRVRAMLGAAGQQLGMDERLLRRLRDSINPLSRFDMGRLACLEAARDWLAKP